MAHKDLTQLIKEIELVKKKIKVGDRYFHCKHPDQTYKIIRVGIIEETEKICVVYEAQYGEKLVWVRPLEDFLSKIELEDGTKVDRFTKVE
jgi:hypothetical protein